MEIQVATIVVTAIKREGWDDVVCLKINAPPDEPLASAVVYTLRELYKEHLTNKGVAFESQDGGSCVTNHPLK